MAISFTNLPKFVKCTFAKYTAAVKDENTLYFVTDKNTFYLGAHQYSFDLVKSDVDPSGTGSLGTLYYNTEKGTAFVYDGTSFLKLGVATLESLSGSVDNTTVPTSKAAKDYVDGRESAILASVASGYVAKESGKSLMTDAERTKLGTYPENYSTVSAAIDGKVAKNTSIASGNLVAAAADGAIADSGVAPATSVTDSDAQLPTGKAVKAYADAAEKAAKEYADGLITSLGSVFEFKGTKENMDALNAISDMKTGDVWHVTTGANGSAAEYVYTGTVWEELGTTLDLSGYVTKKAAAAGKIAEFDSNGDVVGSGLSKGSDSTIASNFGAANTVATEAAVKTYADAKAAEEANKKLAKLELEAANNDEILTVASNGAAVANSGKKFVTEIGAGASDAQVPTAAAVKAYADAVAEEAAGAYLPFVTGATAGNVPVLGANGETLTDSGKSIGTSISDSDAIIPTAKAVKTYADGKIAKIAAPTAGDLVTVDSNGGLVDAHMTAGTATGSFAAAPSATNLPNEQAVAATIQALVDALAWQTL